MTSEQNAISRVVRGSVSLSVRQGLVAGGAVCAGVAYARHLSPAEFGALGLILLVIAAARVVTETGLPAALLQAPQAPTVEIYRAVLTFQLTIAAAIAVILIAAIPLVTMPFRGVPDLGASIVLTSAAAIVMPFSSIAFVRLERDLRLSETGLLLTLQPLSFYAASAIVVTQEVGILGISASFLLSQLLVVPLVSWRVGGVLRPSLRLRLVIPYLRFAGYTWLTGALHVVKDAVTPLLIGGILGAAAAGYVSWAVQVAVLGSYLVMTFSRLLLPVFARLQENMARMKQAADMATYGLNTATAPICCAVVFSVDPLTRVVYGPGWEEALPLVVVISLSNVVTPVGLVAIGILSALGRADLVTLASVGWVLASWLGVTIGVWDLGLMAYGLGVVLQQLVTVALVVRARRAVPFAPVRQTVEPWVFAGLGFGVAAALVEAAPLDDDPARLVGALLLGTLLYMVLASRGAWSRWRWLRSEMGGS